MAIEDYCRRDVATIDVEATCRSAAQRLADENLGCLVVTEKGRVRGVVTDRDLGVRLVREGLDAAHTPLSQFIDGEPIVIGAKRPVRIALYLMRKHAVRRLPVLDEKGRLVGLFAWDDGIRLLAGELAQVAATIARQGPHLPIPPSRALVEIASSGESA